MRIKLKYLKKIENFLDGDETNSENINININIQNQKFQVFLFLLQFFLYSWDKKNYFLKLL